MTTRQLRLLRAASASSVATLLAAVSHTFAGGSAPHPLLVLGLAVFLIPIASLLIGARVSKPRVALTVFISQAVFHLVFQLLGAPAGSSIFLGHHHGEMLSLGTVSVAALPDIAMLAGHVLAAVVTTAALWHGETLVRGIAGWMLALALRIDVDLPVGHRRPAALASHRHPLIDAARAAAVSRRGPPLFS